MTVKTILIVDDKGDVRISLKFLLKNHGYTILEAEDLATAKDLLSQNNIDLVLLDMNYKFDTTSGEEGLNFLRDQTSSTSPPIIAMTAWSSVNLAVEAMQLGAKDFFAKPWDNHALVMMVKKQLALADIARQQNVPSKPHQLSNSPSKHNPLLWHSNEMQLLKKQLMRIAKTDAKVFLRGENGTGKSCIAQFIHNASLRKGQCINVNVGAITETLFESELFGHKKGAFTDAKQDRIGRFEAANNGTLFLDEIGTLALAQQAKLLRVLESNEFERVGDNHTYKANCRIICASNADFETLIDQGAFRTDLYFRLNTIELEVPALRNRVDDIIPLAEYFIKQHSEKYQLPQPTLTQNAQTHLCHYSWPGNVRELSHMMARAVLMNDSGIIETHELAFKPSKNRDIKDVNNQNSVIQSEQNNGTGLSIMTLEEAEKKLLKMAMSQTKNNVEDAAALLGISKSAIYRRLEKFNF